MNTVSGRHYLQLARTAWARRRSHMPAAVLQIADVLLLLLVFVLVNTAVERLTKLPASSYHESSLAIELLRQLGWLVTLTAVAGTAVLARFGHLLATWDELEFGQHLRIFVVVLASAIAWPLVTAGYNYYFDQGYAADKVMLLALLPLVWWRPAFVYPMLAMAYLLLWQLAEPQIGGSILPHKLQVLRALNVFAAAFFVFAVSGNRSAYRFLVLICCFVAAAYWLPALAKLRLGWLSEDGLHLIPLSAYAHGWLAFLPVERIVSLSQGLMPFETAMRAFVIVAEGLCLVFLWRRWLCFALLVLVIVFHLGVFAIYGFFFWTWMILDAALLVLLVRTTGARGADIFNRQTLAVSVVLIALGAAWAKPPQLGWYDTPLTYSYRVEAVDDQGHVRHLHPRFFAPYDDVFTMSGFEYLVPDRAVLVNSYGVTRNRELLHALLDSGDAADVLELEKNSDNLRHDNARSACLEEFLQRFVANRAARADQANWVSAVRAPEQFFSFRGEQPAAKDLRELVLVEITSFYDGKELRDIRRLELERIALPRESGE